MAGKISEYIQIAVKKASDLLDMTVDVGGGLLETRSITALNFFKPRTKTVAFAQPQIVVDFGFETTATVNITGDTTIFMGTYDNGGVYKLILFPDATPRTVRLGSSFGSNLESSNMQFITYPNRPYVIKIYVSNSGQVSNSIEKWQSAPADILAGGNEVVFKTQFGYFTRTLTAISAWIKSALYASEILNDSTNKTGANVKLVIDDLVNHYQQASAPTIASTPALKKDDTWLDTTTLIKYAYTADSNNVLYWVNVNQCGAEIPNVASGERVVTKSTTGVQVAKTLLDMQIAAGTIATANWSTGQATYTGQQGQTTYDANYKYECIGTNKWIRTALMESRLQLYLSPDIDDSLGAKTSAELDTAYPSAVIGQRVWGLLFLYEKKTTNIWKKISTVTA